MQCTLHYSALATGYLFYLIRISPHSLSARRITVATAAAEALSVTSSFFTTSFPLFSRSPAPMTSGSTAMTGMSDPLLGEAKKVATQLPRSPSSTPLTRLLSWDVRVSAQFYTWYTAQPLLPHSVLICLEATGHGLAWLIWPPLLLLVKPHMSTASLSVLINFYLLTVIDVVVIAILKPLFHRARPVYNSGLQAITIEAVDKFSFPSGHATRASSVAAFVVYCARIRDGGGMPGWMESTISVLFTVVWGIAVTASRVALGRHHIVDVVVGAVLGVAYVAFMDVFWMRDDAVEKVRDFIVTRVALAVPSLGLAHHNHSML